jgi:hypothetical protein
MSTIFALICFALFQVFLSLVTVSYYLHILKMLLVHCVTVPTFCAFDVAI